MTRFRILGPLAVHDGDRQVAIGGPQQRALLAALLLERNEVVSAERLIDHLWGSRPPVAARSLLHGCVAQLRRDLPPRSGGRGSPLVTRAPGYLLRVEPGELDLDRFVALDAEAESVLDQDPDGPLRALDLWDQALGWWTGPALDGMAADVCRREGARLDELRVSVQEKRIDAAFRARRAADLVGELGVQVARHPLRERLWEQLMVSLHETGRRAEALAAFRRMRSHLVTELGVEPGPSARDLHQVLLTDGDALAAYLTAHSRPGRPALDRPGSPPPGSGSPPHQMPRASPGFAGRKESLIQLDGLLEEVREQTVVCVLAGMAGVGKTELALAWAHRVRDRFPDGQLFVNLRGYAAPTPPVAPLDALSGFLRALGVTGRLPQDVASSAAQFRSLLSGRRVLVLLDDAASADQVRPLLPGGAGCLVLVTSRHDLGGLVARDGARHLGLDTLDRDDALALLSVGLGAERLRAEPEAAARLVEMCDCLPLALRIVTARLLLHPDRGLADEVTDLASDARLGVLEISGDEDTAVRAVFERSLGAADAGPRRLFGLLGQVPLVDFTAATASALVHEPPAVAAGWLETLADAHLLTRPGPARFGLHDLLRLYATERLRQEEPAAARAEAAYRLVVQMLADAYAADRLLNPNRVLLPLPPDSPRPLVHQDRLAALAWLDDESANLMATVRYAAELGPTEIAWLLASVLKGYFELRMMTGEWRTTSRLGLSAAEAAPNDAGRAQCHLLLGELEERLGNYGPAWFQTARALVLARRSGWEAGECVALADLGILHRHAGRLKVSTRYAVSALALARRLGRPELVAARLMSLGNLHAEAGDLTLAAELYAEVVPMLRDTGSRTGEAIALANLGECRLVLGRPDQAVEFFVAAADLNREVGHRSLAADNLRALAASHVEAGRHALARDLAEAALTEHRATGDRRYEAHSLNVLGEAHRRLGDLEAAVGCHQQALTTSEAIGVHRHEVMARIGLAHCHERLGPGEAGHHAELAASLARGDGLRLLEGPALAARAEVSLAVGDLETAGACADQALHVLQETGQRLGQARVLETVAGIATRRGSAQRALEAGRRAHRLYQDAGVPDTAAVRRLIAGGEPERSDAGGVA